MWNLFKSDVYRLLHSRFFFVLTLLYTLMTILLVSTEGVIVSNSAEKYYAARYIGARRLFEPYQSRDVWELLTERFSINIERGEELHAIDGIIKPYQPSSKQEIKRLTKLKRRYSSRK